MTKMTEREQVSADSDSAMKQGTQRFFREARDLILAFRGLLAALLVIGVSIWGVSRIESVPGVGDNCASCRASCAALGRSLNTETRFAAGRCWVKQWSTN